MSEQSASQTQAPEIKRQPRRWRRWFLIAGLAIVGLFLLVVLLGEIIFATDLPRNLVVNAVQKQLGLKMSAQSLSTGWFGNTSLGNVTLTLPLSDKAFATVPRLNISHSSIPWLLITGDLTIERIEIDDPTLAVVQEADGSWNLLEVVQLVTRAGGSNSAADQPQKSDHSIPALPALEVKNATLVIDDNQYRSLTIKNVGIKGQPSGPLVYEYDAAIPNHLEATGKLAPGGAWAHEIAVHLHHLSAWATPWINDLPRNTSLDAHWLGQINQGVVTGRLNIDHAIYGDDSVAGPMEVVAQDGDTTLKPAGLRLAHGAGDSLSAVVDSGRVVVNESNLQMQQVGITFAGGRASLDGNVGLTTGAADLDLAWRDVAIPSSANQSGSLTLSFAPTLGQPQLSAVLKSSGSVKEGTWDAEVDARAKGPSLGALSLKVSVPRLRVQPNSRSPIDLAGLTAEIEPSSGGYQLTSLSLGPNNNAAGQGGYIKAKKAVWLSLNTRNWLLPGPAPVKIDLDLMAWADPTRVHLDHLHISSGLLSGYIQGEYVADRPKPISAHLEVSAAQPIAIPNQPRAFQGDLNGSVQLHGTISPLNLSIEGIASGKGVQVRQRPLGDLKINLLGGVQNNRVWISSRDIELLGGEWRVRGSWPVPHEVLRLDELSVRHLSLGQAAARDDIQGTLDGDWAIDINSPTADGITVKGNATVKNLAIGGSPAEEQTHAEEVHPSTSTPVVSAASESGGIGATEARPLTPALSPGYQGEWERGGVAIAPVITPANAPTAAPATQPAKKPLLVVDQIDMPDIRLEFGEATIAPITLRRKQDGVSGEATMAVSATLEHPEQTRVEIDAKTWPLFTDPNGATLSAGARGRVNVDLLQNLALGNLDLNGDAFWKGNSVGSMQARLGLQQRSATLSDFSAIALGGAIAGSAHVDLDHPLEATAGFEWKNLNLNQLRDYYKTLGEVTGTLSGSLQLGPATAVRPLEPLYLAIHLNPDHGTVSRLALGKGQIYMYIGHDRLVSDVAADRVSQIDVAGGQLAFWARVSRHEGDLYQSLLELSLNDINLDSLMPPGDSMRKPGILGGQVTLMGRPGQPRYAVAQGNLTLTQSDLASTGPIGFLYGLMHLGHDSSKPSGSGTIELAMQNENLLLPSMRYFDRGTEVRISGQVGSLLSYPNCPITMSAVGAARPFASIDLPAFGDFDRALSAIQSDSISVKIFGTISQPQWKSVPFGELGTETKNFLLLDAFSSRRSDGN